MKKIRIISIFTALLVVLFTGCSTINNLEHYDIYGSRITMEMAIPPQPTVYVDYGNADFGGDHLTAVIQLGTNMLKAGEAKKAEEKLYSALEGLYIPEYAAELTFDRIVKMLDGTMVENRRDADIIFEIDVEKYGLEAYSWSGNVAMVFDMEARFYHPVDNEVIWQRRIHVGKELSPGLFGFDQIVGNVVSMAVLSELEEEDLAEGFQAITRDVMEETVNQLREDIRDARR